MRHLQPCGLAVWGNRNGDDDAEKVRTAGYGSDIGGPLRRVSFYSTRIPYPSSCLQLELPFLRRVKATDRYYTDA